MPTQRKYPDELKERAARMLLEWRAERGRHDGGVPAGPGAAGYDNSAVSADCQLPN